MVDRPIIFSAPMVQALLAGRKTQTRRLARRYREVPTSDDGEGLLRLPTPWQRAQPGDRLWVRENWRAGQGYDDVKPRDLPTPAQVHIRIGYEADDPVPDLLGALRPSIHMPRWASRLTLTVTDVRVQRVQEISEADAQAEGIAQFENGRWHYEANPEPAYVRLTGQTARDVFHDLWHTIHGPGAWDANPEVVALTFTVEQRNIDA
jgi:hypothetical protein